MVAPNNPVPAPDASAGFIFLGYWGKLSAELGYSGAARFVGWYWEPCGDELAWDDGRSSACGMANWYPWVRTISPLLHHLGYDCGSSEDAAKVWLVLDSTTGAAYVARPSAATQFLRQQWACNRIS